MEVKRIKRLINSYPFFLLLLAVMFFLMMNTQKFLKVSGESMVPTLKDKDICFMEPVISPERGQIYVVLEPDNLTADAGRIWAVKRLIGLPGDTVELNDCNTYVNGEQVLPEIVGTWEHMTFELGPDEYLFIGDNRQNSWDGRYWSRPVHKDEILYHVTFRIWPMVKIGRVG